MRETQSATGSFNIKFLLRFSSTTWWAITAGYYFPAEDFIYHIITALCYPTIIFTTVYYTISHTGTNSWVSHFLLSLFIPLTASLEHSLNSEIFKFFFAPKHPETLDAALVQAKAQSANTEDSFRSHHDTDWDLLADWSAVYPAQPWGCYELQHLI